MSITRQYERQRSQEKLWLSEHNRSLTKTPGPHWELMVDAIKALYAGKLAEHDALMRELAALTGSMWYFEKVGWQRAVYCGL